MKVVLIIPPCDLDNPLPTLGVACLSAALKRAGHEALVIDLWARPLTDTELKKNIEGFDPDLIGCTFYTLRYSQTKLLSENLRQWFPAKKIVLGGYHPSALPVETMQEFPDIDFVVIGEGEETIVELLEALSSQEYAKVSGLAYRSGAEVKLTPPRKFIANLDSLPYLDLQQFDPSCYRPHPPYGWYGKTLTMITTRGCPGKCVFCSKSVFKKSLRSFSPQRVVDEIKHWQGIYDFKEIRFYDDDFTITQKRTFEICDLLIKNKINLPWTCTTRVDFLTRELLVKMKEAGMYFITLGVESGSPKVLESLKKGYTVEHIRDAFRWCHELGITTFGFFMTGCPDETPEDVEMTYAIQKEIKPHFVDWGSLRIIPGSQLYTSPSYDFSEDAYPLYRRDLGDKYLADLCRRGIYKHYFSWWGMKAMLGYLYKTKRFNVFSAGLKRLRQ